MADTTGKLPVFETVGKAISYSLKNLLLMVKIVWLWLLLVMAAGTATVLGALRFMDEDSVRADFTPVYAGIAITVVICVLAIYSAAVAWHRGLLLGEHPGYLHLRFGRHELAYLGYALAVLVMSSLGIVVWAGVFVVGSTRILPDTLAPMLSTLVFIAGYAAMVLLIGRLHLVMPGVAVGDRRMSLRRSFELTRGNSWRIFGGFMLVAFLNSIVSVFSSVVDQAPDETPLTTLVALFVLAMISTIVVAFITLSYMSYCYWFFVPSPQEGDLA